MRDRDRQRRARSTRSTSIRDAAAAPLLETIDPAASVVLIGEATHGTHEFYRIRADLTRALIETARVRRRRRRSRLAGCVPGKPVGTAPRGATTRPSPRSPISRAFPAGCGAIAKWSGFSAGCAPRTAERDAAERVGFYGLDLYSLHRSMARVVEYLEKVDPSAPGTLATVTRASTCSATTRSRTGTCASLDLGRSCEDEVVEQLLDLRRRAAEYASRDGRIAADEYFAAEQNARVVCDAEAYYRAMFRGGAESWNLRDRHMMSTLESLLDRAERTGGPARAVVWAHNSHLGDARATGLAALGELNLGQLVRERFGDACCAIGMTTHDGDVTAAHDWDEPAALRRCGRRCRAATSASFTRPECRRSCCSWATESSRTR